MVQKLIKYQQSFILLVVFLYNLRKKGFYYILIAFNTF